jgi:hypothetical protein
MEISQIIQEMRYAVVLQAPFPSLLSKVQEGEKNLPFSNNNTLQSVSFKLFVLMICFSQDVTGEDGDCWWFEEDGIIFQ